MTHNSYVSNAITVAKHVSIFLQIVHHVIKMITESSKMASASVCLVHLN